MIRTTAPGEKKGKKKRITVASAKDKGRRLQKWVCSKISELTGHEWGSNGDDCPIESRPMGQSGTDVRLEAHVQELFPFSVECKWQENWSVHAWMEQAKANQGKDATWILFIRRNDMKPFSLAVLDAEVLFNLLSLVPEEHRKHIKI